MVVPLITNDALCLFSGYKTIHRWMIPPHKSHRVASEYRSLINCRVPAKTNSGRIENSDSHYYSARVKYALEFGAEFPSEVFIYSLDNKNKLRVSSKTPAIDRRAKLTRFFMTNDSPNYIDHDFPTPGYLLTPCGYMEMKSPAEPQMTHDDMGRLHYRLVLLYTLIKIQMDKRESKPFLPMKMIPKL